MCSSSLSCSFAPLETTNPPHSFQLKVIYFPLKRVTMLFNRLIAFALPVVSFALVAGSPAPATAVVKRQLDEAAPLAILTTLQSALGPILPQISTCYPLSYSSKYPFFTCADNWRPFFWFILVAELAANGSADSTTIPPLLTSISSALNTANLGLDTLGALPLHKRIEMARELAERQSGDALADLVAGIVTVSTAFFLSPCLFHAEHSSCCVADWSSFQFVESRQCPGHPCQRPRPDPRASSSP
jgi:hypothetical protein